MEKVAKFEKISYEQWREDFGDNDEHSYDAVLDEIEMPTRSDPNSAGYDIHTPYTITLKQSIFNGLTPSLKDIIFSNA